MAIREQLLHFMTKNIPHDMWEILEENIVAGYLLAHNLPTKHLPFIDATRPRAQLRRYAVDNALVGTAISLADCMDVHVRQTMPKGEHYIVMTAGNITVSHYCSRRTAWPRKAKHRLELAARNAFLEPCTLDLFEERLPSLGELLHVVVLTIHPDSMEDQTQPAQILVVVPYTDWSGYHFVMPIAEVRAAYQDQIVQSQPDQAWPRLREDMQRIEGDESNAG